MIQDYAIPAAIELERAVICAIMRSCGAKHALALAAGVTEVTFANPFLRRVWKVISDIQQGGGKADIVTVCQAMPDDDIAIAEIDGSISTDVNFEQWVHLLREVEAARELQTAAIAYVADAAESTRGNGGEVVAKLAAGVSAAQRVVERCRIRSLPEIAQGVADAMMSRAVDVAVPWFPAGTEGDFSIRHLPGRMYVVCAKTGAGKTALAAAAVREQLKKGLAVAYYCTETDSEGILARIAAQFCGVTHNVLSEKFPDMDKVRKLAEAMLYVSETFGKQLFIRGCETGTGSADGIYAESRRIRESAGRLDVVVVDYLQDIRPPRVMLKATKNDQLTYAVDRIHETLTDCCAAGIVLVQLNREGAKQGGIPHCYHIKDCSTIEQKAHAVIFLHRESDNCPVTKCYTDKVRDQWPFVMDLTWNGVGYESKQQYNSEEI